MRLLLFLMIPFASYSQLEVMSNSMKALDSSIINDIKENKVDEVTVQDILSSVKLKNEIDYVINEQQCLSDKEKKKKRHVAKTKTIEDESFEIVFLAQASNAEAPEEEDIEFIEPTEESQDVLTALRVTKNEQVFYNVLEEKIKQYKVRDRTLKEQAKFAARLSNSILYSNERAAFQPAYNQGRISTFDLITVDQSKFGGICGDIHMAHNDFMKKVNPNLEAFTMSYAVNGTQHVISMIVDPEDPSKMIMNNYSQVQVRGSESTNSITNNSSMMGDVGERTRFFQYKGDRQQHIGTFRNSIGSYLYNLAMDKNMRNAIIDQKPYDRSEFKMVWGKTVHESKKIYKNGVLDKVKNKTFKINNSLTFFRAKTNEGHELMGIMAKKTKNRSTNQHGELRADEKFGTITNTALNISQTEYNRIDGKSSPSYRVYFATGKKVIKRIIEKDGFVFDGYLNTQLEASVISDDSKNITGDADLTINPGLSLRKKTEKSRFDAGVSLNLRPGLKDQVQIFSKESYPNNIQLTPNALNADISYRRFLNKGRIIGANTKYTGTQLGGQFQLSIQHDSPKSGKIVMGYSTPTGGISKNKTNILPRNYRIITGAYTSPEFKLGKKEKAATIQANLNTEFALDPIPFQVQGGVILKFGN